MHHFHLSFFLSLGFECLALFEQFLDCRHLDLGAEKGLSGGVVLEEAPTLHVNSDLETAVYVISTDSPISYSHEINGDGGGRRVSSINSLTERYCVPL